MNGQGAEQEQKEALQNEDELQELGGSREVEDKPKPDPSAELKAELEKVRKELESLKTARPEPRQEQPAPQQYQYKFKASPEMVEAFLTAPDKAASILDSLYQTALQEMAQLVVPYIEERLRPLQTQYAQAQVEALTNQFLQRHKDMEPYLDEARQVANAILTNPQRQYKDLGEFFDDVAEQTRGVVKRWHERLGKGPSDAPTAGSKAGLPGRARTADENEMDVIKSVLGAQ